MAGHSKWANIKHKKERADSKRGKLFTRVIKELTVAARDGGSDPAANPRLRLAIDKASGANMPKDTVQRAIQRGAGELDGVNYEEIRYEGYGPNGVAVIVETMTDNRNRTASNVRSLFSKNGGNLGETGSVGFMFERKGEVVYGAETSEIARLIATDGVTFVTASEAAEAQSADYDITTGLLTLTGDVLLTQGASAISAQRMIVNVKTGTASMEGRVRTVLQQGGN